MQEVKTIIATNKSTIGSFLFYGTLLATLPLLQNQWIVGIIVNFLLLYSTQIKGLRFSLVLCVIPSISALLASLLPIAFIPMIAFIILSNFLYVFIYRKLSLSFFGMIIASCVKFLFLFTSFSLLMIYFEELKKYSSLMSAVQLITALLGGMIAVMIMKKKAASN